MPIKQCVCSICGQTVNKAQTYFVGDGKRACKSHEGVVEKRDKIEEEKHLKAQRDMERLRIRNLPPPPPKPFTEMKPTCWICGVTGLRQQEFFTRVLVEMEKAKKIYGLVNPFDHNHPANKNLGKGACIFVVANEKYKEKLKGVRFFSRATWEAYNFSGLLALCGNCAAKHGIEVLPEVDFDTMAKMGAIYEVAMKPIVEQAASRELGRDN